MSNAVVLGNSHINIDILKLTHPRLAAELATARRSVYHAEERLRYYTKRRADAEATTREIEERVRTTLQEGTTETGAMQRYSKKRLGVTQTYAAILTLRTIGMSWSRIGEVVHMPAPHVQLYYKRFMGRHPELLTSLASLGSPPPSAPEDCSLCSTHHAQCA